jgi:hypothetical protein
MTVTTQPSLPLPVPPAAADEQLVVAPAKGVELTVESLGRPFSPIRLEAVVIWCRARREGSGAANLPGSARDGGAR